MLEHLDIEAHLKVQSMRGSGGDALAGLEGAAPAGCMSPNTSAPLTVPPVLAPQLHPQARRPHLRADRQCRRRLHPLLPHTCQRAQLGRSWLAGALSALSGWCILRHACHDMYGPDLVSAIRTVKDRARLTTC